MAFHIVIVAALIIAPLYATGTIHLREYNKIPVIAPLPPLAPPPGARGRSTRSTHYAPKGEVELYVAKTDGAYGDSEERFLRIGKRERLGS